METGNGTKTDGVFKKQLNSCFSLQLKTFFVIHLDSFFVVSENGELFREIFREDASSEIVFPLKYFRGYFFSAGDFRRLFFRISTFIKSSLLLCKGCHTK